jgi:hypothetical protein
LSVNDLISKLSTCPAGVPGWKQFEDICIEILTYLFVPPLEKPKIQTTTYPEIDRRDAIFSNRNNGSANMWGQIYQDTKARLILVEFKNYDKQEIGKEDVNQTFNYMKEKMGPLAIMCCNKEPVASAHVKRNEIFVKEDKLILFLLPEHLKEMLYAKERGENPAGLILDMIEDAFMKY